MIGIIFTNNLNTCPFIDKYIDICNRTNTEYEVILWNRDGGSYDYPSNYIVYDEPAEVDTAKWKKISGFLSFRKFVVNEIQKKKYEKLIFLTTLTAVLCYGLIQNKYRNKYIFDFRDLGFEKNVLFRRIVKKIINASYFTCMSSPAFAEVFSIDDNQYVMAHNFRYKDIENSSNFKVKKWSPKKRINLLHIGISRGEKYNKRLADVFGNDERFEINIIGRGNDTPDFIQYVKNYHNIYVRGTYNNVDKAKYIEQADLLLYYYPCDYNCNRALANKYYDGLIYKRPLIGNINTYSGIRISKKEVGFSVNMDADDCADLIYDYYNNLDISRYEERVAEELNKVICEDEIYLKRIKDFVEMA